MADPPTEAAMPPPRRALAAQALLLTLIGLAAFLFFAPQFPDPRDVAPRLLEPTTLAHLAIFALIGLTLPHAFPRTPRLILLGALALAAGLAEIAQYAIPARDPSWADLTAGVLGALAVLLPVPRRGEE